MRVSFELASPEALLVSEAADMVVVPGAEGDFGVLPAPRAVHLDRARRRDRRL